MPRWTDEQWQAIEKSGSNILVSAGAGSGKTAVLSERVIHKIENGIHVNELLILTFTKAAASETEFLKEIIKSIVSAFNPENSDSVALDIILPAEKQAEREKFAKEQLSKICTAGVDVQFSKGIQGGFKIAPKGEGYMLSFTDKDFENIIAEYLRPKTKELLFG